MTTFSHLDSPSAPDIWNIVGSELQQTLTQNPGHYTMPHQWLSGQAPSCTTCTLSS